MKTKATEKQETIEKWIKEIVAGHQDGKFDCLESDIHYLIHEVVQQAKKESGLRSCMEIEQQVLYDDFLREPFKKRVLQSIERVKSKYL